MAKSSLSVEFKVSWWLKWYLYGVILTAALTRARPDEDKLQYWIGRAMKITIRGR